LETGEFIKVGENKPTKVNVRIIAATNRDLEKEIQQGNFREDLFYRIAIFQIKLPALRERVVDIEALANSFVSLFSDKTNKKIRSITDEFLEALKQHSWKGNIRELKNVIERSVILTDNNVLDLESLPFDLQNFSSENTHNPRSTFDLAIAEKIHIQKVLNYANGNKTETAKLLNIALTTLYRKLEEYKI
jgi:transcriptional regulator with PAS, ATPase and Fis domain